MKVNAVIFDLDDTLVNTSLTIYPAREIAIKAMIEAGLEVSKFDEALKCLDRIVYFFGSTSYKLIFEVFAKEYSDKNDTELYNKIVCKGIKVYEEYYNRLTTFADSKETLDILITRGFKIGLISNGDSEIQNQKLIKCGLNKYFNENNTAISSDFGYLWVKPAPYLFEYLAGKMKIDLSSSLYVGNSLIDVVGANIAGLISILFKNEDRPENYKKLGEKEGQFTLKNEKPSYKVKNISEILDIIENI